MNIDEMNHDQLNDLSQKIRARQAKLDEEAEAKLWPKTYDLYLHGCEDTNYGAGQEMGLSEQALHTFNYTCYEICITLEVHQNGSAYATHLEGTALVEKVSV